MDSEIKYIKDIEIQAKGIVSGFISGMHHSPYHGFSVEFAEHRPYLEGDNLRFLDWKQYARTGKRLTKQYEDDTNLRCHFILDASASMFYPESYSKIKTAVYAIASIIELLRNQRDAFSLSLIQDQALHLFSEKSTKTHVQQIRLRLAALLASAPVPHNSPDTTLHYIAEHLKKQALIVIFTDGFFTEASMPAFEHALQHFKHNQHDVIVFHVLDEATEVQFNFENQLYRFIDLEQQSEIKINPQALKNIYQNEMQSFLKKWETVCQKYSFDYFKLHAGNNYNALLHAFLQKRNRLKRRL